jgi:hypothetical protein
MKDAGSYIASAVLLLLLLLPKGPG